MATVRIRAAFDDATALPDADALLDDYAELDAVLDAARSARRS
jgi:hypothetical protein